MPQKTPQNGFYVYALYRQDGLTPFYIGKGIGKRMYIHERDAHRFNTHKDRIIQKMLAAEFVEIPKKKLFENLTTQDAGRIERDLIAKFGRWPHGPLANLTDGGDGCLNPSAKSKTKQIVANQSAWANPVIRQRRIDGIKAAWTPDRRASHGQMIRERMTPEYRAKIKAAQKQKWRNPALREKMIAIWNTTELLQSKSRSAKQMWMNPEKRAAIVQAISERQSTPEGRALRSAILKKSWETPEIRQRILTSRKKFRDKNPLTTHQKQNLAKQLNSPQSIAKSRATNLCTEVRDRRVAAQRAAFASPEAQAIRAAASKAMWANKTPEEKAAIRLKAASTIATKKAQNALPLQNETES